jgi:HSP20 family protein
LWSYGLANNSTTNTTIPAVNIKETAENFEVSMAAPGMRKEDFRVELEGNQLTISSEFENQQNKKKVNATHAASSATSLFSAALHCPAMW